MSVETKSGVRRQYTLEEKERAVAQAARDGVRVAAQALGAPVTSVYNWTTRGIAPMGRGAQPEAASVPPAVDPAQGSPPAALPPAAPASAPTRPTARARVAKAYTPSQIAQALERVAAIGVRPAAAELGISRNALRDWERKVAKAARGEGSAPTSGPDPKTVEAARDRAILTEWEKQRGLGPSQIRNQLRRAGTKVSVQTVRRVMEGAGYRPPKVERRDHTGVYEATRPNQLWHMDFIHRYCLLYTSDAADE